MRYPASEKLEIIRTGRTLPSADPADAGQTGDSEDDVLSVVRSLPCVWLPAGLEDRDSGPGRVWNRIPDDVRHEIVDLALDEPELSPRELAVKFTDTKGYFVSEASVYRLLKAHDLITSPAFVVIKAADAFKDKTTAPNQLWQTDFTYFKVIGWGWLVSVDDSGRLFPLHHRLEAVHDHASRGRHRDIEAGAGGLGVRPRRRHAQAPAAE